MQYLLLAAGAAMLTWAAVLFTVSSLAQRSARQALEWAVSAYTASGQLESAPRAPRPDPVVRRGSAIADLSIPRLDLAAVVLHGSDARTLQRGPGHLEGSALPGEGGNVVIAGHRDSFFSPLRDVRVGDDIFVHTVASRLHYRVTWLRIVNPRDLSVLEPTDDETLTLITCYPFWVFGHAPDRFIVRAVRVSDEADADPAVPPSVSELEHAAPGHDRPITPRTVTSAVPAVLDDTTLVRQAIERFRLTYNARLVSREHVGPGGQLQFDSCDVAIADDSATTTCSIPVQDGQPAMWIVALARVDGQWRIRSIVANDVTPAAR